MISADGIQTDPAKTQAVRDWPQPATKKEVSAFLGLCGYYQRFIRDFSTVARPLQDLLTANTPWAMQRLTT